MRGNRGEIFVARFEDFTAHLLVLESVFMGVRMRGVGPAHLVPLGHDRVGKGERMRHRPWLDRWATRS